MEGRVCKLLRLVEGQNVPASSPLPWNPSQVLFWMPEWAEQWAHLDGEDIMRRLINFVFLVDYVFLFLSGARRGISQLCLSQGRDSAAKPFLAAPRLVLSPVRNVIHGFGAPVWPLVGCSIAPHNHDRSP